MPGYVDATNGPLRFKEGVALPAGETLVYVGQDGIPSWHGTVAAVQDATTFSQWFSDNAFNVKSQSVLELAPLAGAVNQYRFSSPPTRRCWAASSRSIRQGRPRRREPFAPCR